MPAGRHWTPENTTILLPVHYLCKLIHSILTMNSIVFNGIYYLQIQGTAMGTRMVPSYANIFMGKLEKEILSAHHPSPLIWLRYIDDVFAVWTHFTLLHSFLDQLNNYHPTIKFTADWSSETVSFLDTKVFSVNTQLTTDLHCKPTDTHQYLHWNSCHAQHCNISIPYSQALCIRRMCSQEVDFKRHLNRRGYDRHHLDQAILQASSRPREDCLTVCHRNTDNTRTPLVVTYHPSLLFSPVAWFKPCCCSSLVHLRKAIGRNVVYFQRFSQQSWHQHSPAPIFYTSGQRERERERERD